MPRQLVSPIRFFAICSLYIWAAIGYSADIKSPKILNHVVYTDPVALRSAIAEGEDANLLLHNIDAMSILFNWPHSKECLQILLNTPGTTLNDPGDDGCALLQLTATHPEMLNILLNNGAKPYWKARKLFFRKRVYLLLFLFDLAPIYGGGVGMKSFEIAINHPSCQNQLKGRVGRLLLSKANKLKAADVGACATGYEEYVGFIEKLKRIVKERVVSD